MSFKVLFSLITYHDLNYKQMNVIIAFLNALLKERIYVKQFKSYEKKDKENTFLIYLLLRALYGLK